MPQPEQRTEPARAACRMLRESLGSMPCPKKVSAAVLVSAEVPGPRASWPPTIPEAFEVELVPPELADEVPGWTLIRLLARTSDSLRPPPN